MTKITQYEDLSLPDRAVVTACEERTTEGISALVLGSVASGLAAGFATVGIEHLAGWPPQHVATVESRTTPHETNSGFRVTDHETGVLAGVLAAGAVYAAVKHQYKKIVSRMYD